MAGGRLPLACGVLSVSMLLAACAPNSPTVRTPSTPGDSVVLSDPPRSRRGNPPFYDVLGKRYHVLRTSAGYRERGVASWYGPDFHGLSTSSGETYDMHAMTAAHTTLPIPTWVEVTNLENGKRAIVKINDRGPFVGNRIIDLSFAAATALDVVQKGTARVEVRAIGAPSSEPATITTAALEPPPGAASTAAVSAATAPAGVLGLPQANAAAPRMFVQVGAFAEQGNAARLVGRLEASGFPRPVVVSDGDGRRAMHRVRLGPIRDAAEFDELRARLRTIGLADAQLVVDR